MALDRPTKVTFLPPPGLGRGRHFIVKGEILARLTDIEGIDENVAQRLRSAGIRSAECLLRNGATRAGRLQIGVRSGIGKSKIQGFVEKAGLLRSYSPG
jgi:hypothetical protein